MIKPDQAGFGWRSEILQLIPLRTWGADGRGVRPPPKGIGWPLAATVRTQARRGVGR